MDRVQALEAKSTMALRYNGALEVALSKDIAWGRCETDGDAAVEGNGAHRRQWWLGGALTGVEEDTCVPIESRSKEI